MVKKVIINADDFGMSEAFNYGAIKAYNEGIVSSTSIMINQEAVPHAVSLLKQAPGLYVGLHVNLTTGSPVSDPAEIPNLVNPDGSFIGSAKFKTHEAIFSYKDVYTETEAQIQKFRQVFGFYPSHIEPHSAMDDNSIGALIALANKYQLHYGEVPYQGHFVQSSSEKYWQVESVLRLDPDYMNLLNRGVGVSDFISDRFGVIKNHDNGLITEFHFHPGYVDQYVLQHSGLTLARTKDLATLCSNTLKGWIQDNDIQLVSFGDLKK
ncbi:ChbG/HpnK family deacetylase [Lactobacillus sp. ESL0677]|uniref:ChbG/HpnK family deacetylase n=1 Tax=Lactobacillus sp. ESL0677 TaxID=2983208 RepID=UPI0023F6F507|nr:ChbG/HpnK family deacetylase [Lactobacillus sp. ESL0677]WEV37655.1 ChbG/HpnK family deacetylase [Lactobacillus sp. ESL0677]